MANRPDFTELLMNAYTHVTLVTLLNFLALLALIFTIAALYGEFKEDENKEKKPFRYSAFIVVLIWTLGIGIMNGIFVKAILEPESTTTQNDFFDNKTNEKWYAENFAKLYENTDVKTYDVLKLIKLTELNETQGDVEFGKSIITDNKSELWSRYDTESKEEVVYKYLKNKEREAEVFYVELLVKNENNKVKNVSGFVNVSYDESANTQTTMLQNTKSVEGDPGEEIYFGDLIVKEQLLK